MSTQFWKLKKMGEMVDPPRRFVLELHLTRFRALFRWDSISCTLICWGGQSVKDTLTWCFFFFCEVAKASLVKTLFGKKILLSYDAGVFVAFGRWTLVSGPNKVGGLRPDIRSSFPFDSSSDRKYLALHYIDSSSIVKSSYSLRGCS